jgi:hypothetical protein
MRFAWLRKKSRNDGPVEQSPTERLIFTAYNIVYWVPLALPLVGVIAYRTGIIAFAAVVAIRAVFNWYRVNVLSVEQAQHFPFRSP